MRPAQRVRCGLLLLFACGSAVATGNSDPAANPPASLHTSSVPCAACHGTPQPAAPLAEAPQCTPCHESVAPHSRWRGSSHERAGLDCASCHVIHQSRSPAGANGALLRGSSESETCFACHGELRRTAMQRSSHFFRETRAERRIECSSCHDAHGGATPAMLVRPSVNDVCFSCHADKRGPFLWEHAPVREDCGNCHAAHGSNNRALLTMRVPMLCQSCHVGDEHVSMEGHPRSAFETNRGCVNCHAFIHGSNHPSGVTLQR